MRDMPLLSFLTSVKIAAKHAFYLYPRGENMNPDISRSTAQNIVETVKELCGYDINFIDTDGYIFASTNSTRIGDFHEIGKKVAETGRAIEVTESDTYWGTHAGVNEPFFYEGSVAAVIGITGNPEEVRKYTQLAARITLLILREHELASRSVGQRTATNYIIRSLVNGEPLNMDYFADFCAGCGLNMKRNYRTLVARTGSRYNPANLTFIEKDVYEAFDAVPKAIYRFQYPNEYVMIFESSGTETARAIMQKLLTKYSDILRIGIGSDETIFRQNKSYEAALLSIRSSRSRENVALYDDFDLEILIGSISDNASARFLQKVAGKLSDDDMKLLRIYYDEEMSLNSTAERLFIHKNTLQYRLRKIHEESGYDPRSFRDAALFYLALQIERSAASAQSGHQSAVGTASDMKQRNA